MFKQLMLNTIGSEKKLKTFLKVKKAENFHHQTDDSLINY